MSSFLDAVRQRVVIYDGAFGTGIQEQDLTADDFGGPDLEGCNEMLVRHPARRHRASCTPTYFEVGVDVVETNTFGALRRARSASTASPTGPTRSTWPRPASPARWPTTSRRPTAPGSSPARSARAPSSPSLGQIRFADLRDAYEVAGRGPARRRRRPAPHRDPVRPARRQGRDDRRPAGDGRRSAARCRSRCRSPSSSPAACCPAPRSAPRSPRSTPMKPDVIGINCATGPAEMSEHLRHLVASTPACRSRACPTPACRRSSTARCTTTSRPSSSPSTTRRFVTELGVAGRRRLLRHHARAPRGRGRRAAATSTPADAHARARGRRHVDLLVRAVRPGHVVPDHRRAHQRQRLEEVPRGDARRRLGHAASQMAKDQVKEGAHVLDVCVDYVGRDGTARHGRDRQPLRHPGRRVPARARLHRAAGHGGRAAVARRPGHPQLGQPRGRRAPRARASTGCSSWPGSTAPPSSACSSTRRARPATSSGRCGSPTASTTSPSTATASSRATSSSTRSPSRCRPATTTCAATRWPPSRRSAASRPSCPACTPRSAVERVASASSPAARHVLNSVFLHECVRGRPRLGHRARGADHAAQPHPRRAARGLPRPHLRPPPPGDRRRAGLRPAAEAARGVRRREGGRGREGGPLRLADRAAADAAHHRRRPRRPRPTTSTRRWPTGITAARHHQRRAARRHEGRRRAVRLRARCSCRSCCSRPRR